MYNLSDMVWIETRKAIRSRMPLWTALGALFMPLGVAGLIFLADNLGWLATINLPQAVLPAGMEIIKLSTWTLIFLGAGVIGLLEGILRLFFPAWRNSAGGTFFMAILFMGIGLGNIFGWSVVWPLVLIGLGLSALAGALIRLKK